jgi:hypothetical protein
VVVEIDQWRNWVLKDVIPKSKQNWTNVVNKSSFECGMKSFPTKKFIAEKSKAVEST